MALDQPLHLARTVGCLSTAERMQRNNVLCAAEWLWLRFQGYPDQTCYHGTRVIHSAGIDSHCPYSCHRPYILGLFQYRRDVGLGLGLSHRQGA